eukprot:TRINITY_DN4058_c0_g2_i1.p2 TRINITY_DN4058_c0_g2~~TRINITY_DN4058_c0_g2_i1.p2  ORF type:complete len:341 (+),score=105.50 TRINITY_DN4058_c0_g2_i1:1280-2302(+)
MIATTINEIQRYQQTMYKLRSVTEIQQFINNEIKRTSTYNIDENVLYSFSRYIEPRESDIESGATIDMPPLMNDITSAKKKLRDKKSEANKSTDKKMIASIANTTKKLFSDSPKVSRTTNEEVSHQKTSASESDSVMLSHPSNANIEQDYSEFFRGKVYYGLRPDIAMSLIDGQNKTITSRFKKQNALYDEISIALYSLSTSVSVAKNDLVLSHTTISKSIQKGIESYKGAVKKSQEEYISMIEYEREIKKMKDEIKALEIRKSQLPVDEEKKDDLVNEVQVPTATPKVSISTPDPEADDGGSDEETNAGDDDDYDTPEDDSSDDEDTDERDLPELPEDM